MRKIMIQSPKSIFPNFFIIMKLLSLFFKTANLAQIVSQRGLTHTFREIVHF